MKKSLLSIFILCLTVGAANAQFRYLDEIFTDVTVSEDAVFGSNQQFFPPGSFPFPVGDLLMDIYSPTGDNETGRACVIVLHTGNFLPKYINQTPSGNNKDSSIVEVSKLFAKRGYLVATPNYRAGWNPLATDADERRTGLINAVYRGLNDVKTCVRYLKSEAATFGIDPEKIIIYGQGTGGYLATNYASLDRIQEFEIAKFTTALGDPMIDTSLVGGIDGFGGLLNEDNHPGFTNDVLACINAGGALGDSSWLEPGEPVLISFHSPNDPFAPFNHGIVIVPTTQEAVVPVSGSKWIIGEANLNGNNDALRNVTFTDPYSLAAYSALQSSMVLGSPPVEVLDLDPVDYEGLFPFILPSPGASPWDWWDETVTVAGANAFGQNGQTIFDNSLLTNPDMSATKARAYLDSIQGYLAPRLRTLLEGDVSVKETDFVNANTFIFPNPSNDFLVVKTNQGIRINEIEIFNVTGALVRAENNLSTFSHQIDGIGDMTAGLYLVKVTTDSGIITRKAFVQ